MSPLIGLDGSEKAKSRVYPQVEVLSECWKLGSFFLLEGIVTAMTRVPGAREAMSDGAEVPMGVKHVSWKHEILVRRGGMSQWKPVGSLCHWAPYLDRLMVRVCFSSSA